MKPGNWRARRRGSLPNPTRTPSPPAHELLARIALAQGDKEAARGEAELARRADPGLLPLPLYVEGRLLYDEGRYNDALPLFERAASESERAGDGPRIADLHYHAGDTFLRLERYAEAEYQLLLELKRFPRNMRARSALATLYHTTGRAREAADMAADLVRLNPTPEGYTVAARLWTTLGNRREAAALRVKARQVLAPRRRPPHFALVSWEEFDVRRAQSRLWSYVAFVVTHACSSFMPMLP